jgi:anti-sigma factor RsiW
VGAFWWIDDGLGYAVSGPADRPRLLRVAQSIYGQVASR